jgi:hypothetical protein
MQMCRATFLHSPIPKDRNGRHQGPLPPLISVPGARAGSRAFGDHVPSKGAEGDEPGGLPLPPPPPTAHTALKAEKTQSQRRSHDASAGPRWGHRPGCDLSTEVGSRQAPSGPPSSRSAAGKCDKRASGIGPRPFPAPWPSRRPHHHH